MNAHRVPRIALVAPLAIFACSCDPWSWVPSGENPIYCDSTTLCADPARPYCDLAKSQCEASPVDGGALPCGNSLACTDSATPICDISSGTCRECQSHDECPSKACLADGRCAPVGQVAFVDNGNCASGTPDGTEEHPYCEIKDAFSESGAPLKPYVVVGASGTAYDGITVASGNVTVLGPRPAASAAATLTPKLNGQDGVLISGAATVNVDGLEIAQAGVGLKCNPTTGNATLVVTHSAIHDCTGAGVNANGCTVTLDGNTIISNQGGGVRMVSSSYTITNNIIALNHSSTVPGVSLDVESSGAFAFNTVARNTVNSGLGGIDCGTGAMKTIQQSIVWENTKDGTTQLGSKCTLQNVVTGASDSTGTKLDPAFKSLTDPFDFHLSMATEADVTANMKCCVDQLITDPKTANSKHDVDLSPRPQGGGWDIGAHEAQ